MSSSGNLSLNWSDYGANISESFKRFSSTNIFSDVTLACEDEIQMQAHKVILSACSLFFQNILEKNGHPHPLLYLKGIKSHHLSSIIDFIYTGEVTVPYKQLDEFLVTAKELKLKGLSETQAEVKGEEQVNFTATSEDIIRMNDESIEVEVEFNNENVEDNEGDRNSQHYEPQANTDQLPIKNLEKTHDNFTIKEELDKKISKPIQNIESNNMYEKIVDLWQCKVCQKTTKQKGDIKRHYEGHIEGVSYQCKSCPKSYKTSASLVVHKSRDHSKKKTSENLL